MYILVQLKVFACSNTESRVLPFSTVLKMPVELQTICVKSEVLIVVWTCLTECVSCSVVGGSNNVDEQEAPGNKGGCLKMW